MGYELPDMLVVAQWLPDRYHEYRWKFTVAQNAKARVIARNFNRLKWFFKKLTFSRVGETAPPKNIFLKMSVLRVTLAAKSKSWLFKKSTPRTGLVLV